MRFRYLRYSGLKNLVKKQSMQGLPNLNFENKFYEGCVIGKQMRRQFGKSKFSTTRPLKLIHTDICGPITPDSFSEKEYFITFIDDYSRNYSPRDTPCRTRRSNNTSKDERVPKGKLEMDESLKAREHQGARDEALAPMKNMTLLTSVACVRDS
jgi:hypothetical protein